MVETHGLQAHRRLRFHSGPPPAPSVVRNRGGDVVNDTVTGQYSSVRVSPLTHTHTQGRNPLNAWHRTTSATQAEGVAFAEADSQSRDCFIRWHYIGLRAT